VISKVEVITKLAARNTYQTICQGPYESIISYKERFNSSLKAYQDQDNPSIAVIDNAIVLEEKRQALSRDAMLTMYDSRTDTAHDVQTVRTLRMVTTRIRSTY